MVVIMTTEEFKKFKNDEIEKGEIIFDIKDLEKAFEAAWNGKTIFSKVV